MLRQNRRLLKGHNRKKRRKKNRSDCARESAYAEPAESSNFQRQETTTSWRVRTADAPPGSVTEHMSLRGLFQRRGDTANLPRIATSRQRVFPHLFLT